MNFGLGIPQASCSLGQCLNYKKNDLHGLWIFDIIKQLLNCVITISDNGEWNEPEDTVIGQYMVRFDYEALEAEEITIREGRIILRLSYSTS